MPIRSLRSGSLNKNVCPVIGAEIVSSISRKDIGLGINEPPVSAHILNLA